MRHAERVPADCIGAHPFAFLSAACPLPSGEPEKHGLAKVEQKQRKLQFAKPPCVFGRDGEQSYAFHVYYRDWRFASSSAWISKILFSSFPRAMLFINRASLPSTTSAWLLSFLGFRK